MESFWTDPARGLGLAGGLIGIVLATVGLLASISGGGMWLLGAPSELHPWIYLGSAAMSAVGCVGAFMEARHERLGAWLMFGAALGGPGAIVLLLALLNILIAVLAPEWISMFLVIGLVSWIPLGVGVLGATFMLLLAARLALQDGHTNAAS